MDRDLVLVQKASVSANEVFLSDCLSHKSGFVQVAVAMNPKLNKEVLDECLSHENDNVVCWALVHPRLTKKQFDSVYQRWEGHIFNPKIQPSLAASPLCDDEQFITLAEEYAEKFLMVSEVVSRLSRKSTKVVQRIAKQHLPPEDKRNRYDARDWTPEQTIAYHLYFGQRRPNS